MVLQQPPQPLVLQQPQVKQPLLLLEQPQQQAILI
jgi:hypothetical protein